MTITKEMVLEVEKRLKEIYILYDISDIEKLLMNQMIAEIPQMFPFGKDLTLKLLKATLASLEMTCDVYEQYNNTTR